MRTLFATLVLLLLVGCGETPISATAPAANDHSKLAELVTSPAAPGAGEPFLSVGAGETLLMSWIEPAADSSHAVRFARYEDGEWSDPVTITQRSDLFVNWADFPSVVQTPEGTMYAHWLQKSGDAPYAYDVMYTISSDQGATWNDPVVLHTDGVVSEHGFVSLVPEADGTGSVGALWLDGRKMIADADAGGHGGGPMTLRFARIHPDGSVTDRTELDDRVCECCQTSMTKADDHFVAIYRDRSDEEIRDIGIVRQTEDGWTAPEIVHHDGWEIAGCPVNGPQIDSSGSEVAVAWATGADGEDRVFAVFSDDRGATFSEPVRVDEGGSIGRVDNVILDDGSMLVVWLGQTEDEANVFIRRIDQDRSVSPIRTVGSSSTSRSAGFPKMVRLGDSVYVAWTVPGDQSRVQIARVDIKEIS